METIFVKVSAELYVYTDAMEIFYPSTPPLLHPFVRKQREDKCGGSPDRGNPAIFSGSVIRAPADVSFRGGSCSSSRACGTIRARGRASQWRVRVVCVGRRPSLVDSTVAAEEISVNAYNNSNKRRARGGGGGEENRRAG